MKLLRLAYRNVMHRPLNLLLSVLLFGLGIGLINFLILFNAQLKSKFDSNLAEIDLVIGAKGSPLQMILSSMYHIDSPTGNITIAEVKPFLNPKHPLIKAAVPLSLGDSYRSYRIVGTTDSLMSFYHATLQQGKMYSKNLEVVVGRTVADETGLALGDKFKSAHGFNDDEDLAHDHAAFEVVGILNGTGSVIDQLILTNPSTVWVVHDHEEEPQDQEEDSVNGHEGHDHVDHDHDGDGVPDHAPDAHVDHDHDGDGVPDHAPGEHHDHEHDNVHDHADTQEGPLAKTNADLLNFPDKQITTLLIKYRSRSNFQALSMPRSINENTDMQAASPAIEINRLYDMIGSGRQALDWLARLIAIISAISIFIVLYKSMRERRYELALIRVMGGSRGSIFSLITLEGMLLTSAGFFVGFVLSHIGLEILAGSLASSYKYSFSGWYFMRSELYLLLASLGIGVMAALLPAIGAARMDIHRTLTEG